MSNDPCNHNFNWAAAWLDSSIDAQFEYLRNDVMAVIAVANQVHETRRTGEQLEAAGGEDEHHFGVYAVEPRMRDLGLNGITASAHFRIHDGQVIAVVRLNRGPEDGEVTYTLRSALSSVGECRYSINDEGAWLRWQVVRKIIEPVAFPFD